MTITICIVNKYIGRYNAKTAVYVLVLKSLSVKLRIQTSVVMVCLRHSKTSTLCREENQLDVTECFIALMIR